MISMNSTYDNVLNNSLGKNILDEVNKNIK